MSFNRTASPPELPVNWIERLQDLAAINNILNGNSGHIDESVPTAYRLQEFFADPIVSELWQQFNVGKPKL